MQEMLWRASWNRPGGTPVLFIPGIRLNGEGRTRLGRLLQRAALVPLSWSVPVWLLRRDLLLRSGFTRERPVSLETIADEAAVAISQQFGSAIDVVGESTGGSIALLLAARHPDIVRRLVVVSSAARMSDAGQEAQKLAVRALRNGRFTAAAVRMLVTGIRWPAHAPLTRLAAWFVGVAVTTESARDAADLMEAEDGYDLRTELDRIRARTLLVGGSRDGFYPPDLIDETARLIPSADSVILLRRGHLSATAGHRVRSQIRRQLR
ncbi:alpha/beta fold hydrolase [Curtobacterium ammoniigenes]|uniref:alpha/beta fold hydrolase n=1 Tax=Curtobacterium ammoniigenes TaxID=395387 RepID=UPI0008347778|nr:alpha/beta fold hydrolase [Curtobacterium ammoniigenes]